MTAHNGDVPKSEDGERKRIDGLLISAVREGANILMDESDWASIRGCARATAAATKAGDGSGADH